MSSRLPSECILPIVQHLALCQEHATLYSLLTTSKTMFALIAPIVFAEPFAPSAPTVHIYLAPRKKLCQKFLSSRPIEQLPKLLQLVYFPEYSAQEPCKQGRPSPISLRLDYSLYIRRLHFSILAPMHPDFHPYENSNQIHPLEKQIVQEITKSSEPFFVLDEHNLSNSIIRKVRHSKLLSSHLRVALTWTLCEPILEQIQSIDIPLSDVDRYLSVVHRFRSLSSVTFTDDIAIDCRSAVKLSDLVQQGYRRAKFIEEFKAKALDSMAQFVDEAVRLHGTQLCRVAFKTQGDGRFHRTKPPPVVAELAMKVLPPLTRPRVLNNQNWAQLAKYIDSTCLDFVTTISTPNGPTWHADLAKVGPLWSQCRSLEDLQLNFFPAPVSFRWALDKKIRRQQGLDQKWDFPLRCISVFEYSGSPVMNIDDLAIAFSDTLEKLQYCRCVDRDHPDATFQATITVGRQWTMMPALKDIRIAVRLHDLVLDPVVLRMCPALQHINLDNMREDFDPTARTWEEPLQLPELKTIKLEGMPAQSFNMDTFGSTPLIQSIQLSVSNAGQCLSYDEEAPGYDYDPSLPNTPHQWSWDWYLPCLTELLLGAGFASLFEFRMLDGCPALNYLFLAMAGADAPRGGRHVRETDLVSRGTASGYISCPNMTGLTLRGQFILLPEVLQILFTHVMPNLRKVTAHGCRGHGAVDWVKGVQTMKDLDGAFTDVPDPTEAEMKQLGLKLDDGYSVGAMYEFEKMYIKCDSKPWWVTLV